MKSVITWAIHNSPAMNTLMIAALLVGGFSLGMMRREVFPEFDLEIILVTVPYPGASPEEVEEGICQKIEEAVRSIAGIKKQTSIAAEGAGSLILELEADPAKVQKILNEVRSEVDRIPSFPDLAEDPEVKQITIRIPAIRVGILAEESDDPQAEVRLRDAAERVRNELLQLGSVSQANIVGARDYQIDIEIDEDTLRKYGLTLQEVARIVRRENLELPGGSMKTQSQEVLLRGKNKRLTGEEIAKIPLVTEASGVVLTVGDLGVVRDEFTDTTAINRINGRPGLTISIDRTSSEDLLEICEQVKGYVNNKQLKGYELMIWDDQSVHVKDRLDMLVRNGISGLILVFLVLAVFLELRLAFWVSLGIPIAVLGAGAVLLYMGHTLNMLSMFAFLMALGIVVDDAIVIGENIYEHRQRGKPLVRAAIDGAYEVLPSVAASVSTTIIAFVPLMFVAGVMGKFIAVMPVAVIAMLVISLIESTFVLPCHLAHRESLAFTILGFFLYPVRFLGNVFKWLNEQTTRLLENIIERFYIPSLSWSLRNPAILLSSATSVLLVFGGLVCAGLIPYAVFPKLDTPIIEAKITYPDGSPADITDRATQHLEETILAVERELASGGNSLILNRHRAVGQVRPANPLGDADRTEGSHVGSVTVELTPTDSRDVTSQQILDLWRERSGEFPGAESVVFAGSSMGPGGTPIEFKLLAPPTEEGVRQLEAAVEATKDRLRQFEGVKDVTDDSRPGKWEFQLRMKPKAMAMGVPLADLAETVRASYYGDEVMRLQRGRHEVKLMVRYPREDRKSLADFDEIRVRTGDGSERPLTELAAIDVRRGYSEINRVDQMRSITISADVQEGVANAQQVVGNLRENFIPDMRKQFPMVSVRWEGQQEQNQESMQSLVVGFGVALLAMFVLLTVEFRSYAQPLIILAIIPFGAIGAVIGHAVMGLTLTLFSVFGLVALTGVVINDSIVLIDFINHRIAEGMPLSEALVEAGRRRFRPVLLTSMTTVAGLVPMLLETSFQAQVMIPMANSLCFGLMAATALILFLVPTFYLVYGRSIGIPDATPDVSLPGAAQEATPAAGEPVRLVPR